MCQDRTVTEPVMGSEETLTYMLNRAQRKAGTPVRRAFVQGGTRYNPKPGPLSQFVHNRDQTGLDLFLLALTLATKEPYRVIYAAGWWARALGMSDETLVSRAWKRLEHRQLVTRKREGRVLIVTPLRDDGLGDPYERPALKGEAYGKLPLVYWRDGYYKELDLAAKATLLIALCQHGAFTLPSEHAKAWYGISADTVERGLATLRRRQILTRRADWRLSRYAQTGFAKTYIYELQPPFASGKELRLKVVS